MQFLIIFSNFQGYSCIASFIRFHFIPVQLFSSRQDVNWHSALLHHVVNAIAEPRVNVCLLFVRSGFLTLWKMFPQKYSTLWMILHTSCLCCISAPVFGWDIDIQFSNMFSQLYVQVSTFWSSFHMLIVATGNTLQKILESLGMWIYRYASRQMYRQTYTHTDCSSLHPSLGKKQFDNMVVCALCIYLYWFLTHNLNCTWGIFRDLLQCFWSIFGAV